MAHSDNRSRMNADGPNSSSHGATTALRGTAAILTALDSLPDAILVLDRDDRISHYNSALVTLYGDAATHLELGRSFGDLVAALAETKQRYGQLPESAEILREGRRQRIALPTPNHRAGPFPDLTVQRLALHAIAPCDYEELTAHGRWLHVSTRLASDGGKTIIHRDITHWKARELQLEHTVLHDPATGLPNRTLFMDRLAQELRRCARDRDRTFGVTLIDIDRYRLINEELGHERATAVLAAVARRLERVVRPSDTVGHLDGGTFGCVIEDLSSQEEAKDFAARVEASLSEPIQIDGLDVEIRAGMGIALGDRTVASGGDLVRDAMTALARAKDEPGLRAAVFDDVMRSTAQTRYRMDAQLRQAIRRRELRLAYQPIIEVETFALVGFEGLARWGEEGHDAIGPDIFIKVAEDSNLIVPLGRLALDLAAEQLSSWLKHDPKLFVTVNVSARQLGEHDLASDLNRAIDQYTLPRESLHLEITESTVVEYPEKVADALAEIKRLGVRICIDDFGTGYSSLHLLQAMPYDVLKIDRSFISTLDTSPRSRVIIETITDMAHRMGMRVVAEGIERHDQLAMIRRAGCDYAQGFLFAPPLEAADAAKLASEGRLTVA
jgi:diguanylate cyclase (GGDEF)-like protein